MGFLSSFQEEKIELSRATIHFPKVQPSNGQAFSSMTGRDGPCAAALSAGPCPAQPGDNKQRTSDSPTVDMNSG